MEKVGALKLDAVILNMIEIWWLYHDGFLWALAMLHDGYKHCNTHTHIHTHTLSPPAFSHSFLCQKSTKKECIPGRSAEPKRLQMSRCAPSFLRPWKGVGGTRALAHLYIYICIQQMPGLCPEPQRQRATHRHHHHQHHHHQHHHHHHQLNVDFNISRIPLLIFPIKCKV